MAIIKKPIKKTLFYLSSLLGIVFVLIAGLVFRNFQYNLSQLESKAKSLFKAILISSAEAQCWTPPAGGNVGIGGGGDGDGGISSDGPADHDGDVGTR